MLPVCGIFVVHTQILIFDIFPKVTDEGVLTDKELQWFASTLVLGQV